jgi:hypothetical protein
VKIREAQNQIWLPLQPLFASFREPPEDPTAKSLSQMIVASLVLAASDSVLRKAKKRIHWHVLELVRAKNFVELALHRPAAEIWRTSSQLGISDLVVYWWTKQRRECRNGSLRMMARFSAGVRLQLEGQR